MMAYAVYGDMCMNNAAIKMLLILLSLLVLLKLTEKHSGSLN